MLPERDSIVDPHPGPPEWQLLVMGHFETRPSLRAALAATTALFGLTESADGA
jgi:hypothetical protein